MIQHAHVACTNIHTSLYANVINIGGKCIPVSRITVNLNVNFFAVIKVYTYIKIRYT